VPLKYGFGMTTILAAGQAAEKLGFSTARLRKLRSLGRITGIPLGTDYVYDVAEIRRFSRLKRPTGRPRSSGSKAIKKMGKSAAEFQ
jgi:hypothetical protein